MAVGHDQTNKQTNPKTTQNQNHFCTDLYKSHFNSRGQSFLSFALEHRLDSAGRLRKVFLNHTNLMSWPRLLYIWCASSSSWRQHEKLQHVTCQRIHCFLFSFFLYKPSDTMILASISWNKMDMEWDGRSRQYNGDKMHPLDTNGAEMCSEILLYLHRRHSGTWVASNSVKRTVHEMLICFLVVVDLPVFSFIFIQTTA